MTGIHQEMPPEEDPPRRAWRRQTGMAKFERTSAWPYVSEWAFKRGTDAPLGRRGRLIYAMVLGIIVVGGILLLAVSSR